MVMLDLFHRADFHFSVAHCNFKLRDAESDGDEQFVKQITESCGSKFYAQSFETAKYAQTKNISIQMSARELRQQWMEMLMEKENFKAYATAHHHNDAIETFLFKTTKGTGIAGMHGILPKNGRNIHPMLFATRKEIYEYAHKNSIQWREDKSNETTKYHRNLIRHEIIPRLKKINPGLEETFYRTFKRIRFQEEFYKAASADLISKITHTQSGSVWIEMKALKEIVGFPAILLEILQPLHFNFEQVLEIAAHLDGSPGKLFYSSSHVVNIDRDHLIISPKLSEKNESMTVNPGDHRINFLGKRYDFQLETRENLKILSNKNIALTDAAQLSFPLKIRPWKPGDWFIPLGMKGKKKLSDFMIDEKIPLNLKRDVQVITSENNIVWVVGHRLDDRYKIQRSTRTVFEISVIEND